MKYCCCILSLLLLSFTLRAQEKDTAQQLIVTEQGVITEPSTDTIPLVKDSAIRKKEREIIPRKAIIRSAIIPGWGQIYNGKAWKVPIVYAALGITGYVFVDNLKTYRLYRDTYRLLRDDDPSNDDQIDPQLRVFDESSIRLYRDEFRRYIDYSVLFFIFFWGLNVVEATVDAHLSTFDVSEDLGIYLKPGYSPMANTSGISLVWNIGKKPSKTVFSLR